MNEVDLLNAARMQIVVMVMDQLGVPANESIAWRAGWLQHHVETLKDELAELRKVAAKAERI